MTTGNKIGKRSPVLLLISLALLLFVTAACSTGGDEAAPAADTVPVEATTAPTEEPAPEPTAESVAEATAVPTEEATQEATPEAAPEAATEGAGGPVTLVIDSTQSEARYYIDELLLGEPKRVEGITSQVSGEVTVNLADYTDIAFSPITIAADSFATDSSRRDGAVNRFVLQTGQYPTINFTPTGVENWPTDITVGQAFSFDLVGELTIRDITSQETLAMTVTPVSESELSGAGSVTVLRETYQLTIPNVPSVANVSEEVLLEIDFVAIGD